MNSGNEAHNTKKWLAEFLLTRMLTKSSLGKPLYSYIVTHDEYHSLLLALQEDKASILHPIRGISWSACFCLIVSERYRREYDANDGGWTWKVYENLLGISLSHSQITQIVVQGLKFWDRPLKYRESGIDYLGTLFAEGGLPWPLLRSDAHGFGRTVKSGLKNYERLKNSGKSLVDLVSEHQQYFPRAFQNTEVYILLASIIESLMSLARMHDLQAHKDPATYLDEHQPNWRDLFPLPIGESNAKALVNEWLRNAGARQKEIEEARAQARSFTADHSLKGELSNWSIESTVFLPREEEISLSSPIPSTRLEMVFLEGDDRILNAGIVYARLDESRTKISLKFPQTEYKIVRKQVDNPLTFQLLSNGTRVSAFYIQNSDLDIDAAPLIFGNDDEHSFIANASTFTSKESVLVRCPIGSSVEPFLEYQETDGTNGAWYRLNSDSMFSIKGSSYYVRFRENFGADKPVLKGRLSLYDTLPNLTYYGLPSAELPPEVNVLDGATTLYLDKLPVHGKKQFGAHALTIETEERSIIFNKKIGILPEDLMITSYCASQTAPAQIHLHTTELISVAIVGESLRTDISHQAGMVNIHLEPRLGVDVPRTVHIEVRAVSGMGNPVILRLPYPYQGVTIFDAEGQVVDANTIALNDLLGMSMQLTGFSGRKQNFYMVTELLCSSGHTLRRSYQFNVSAQPVSVSLHAFYDDLMQILSAVPDQDAKVRVRIETDQMLKQFQITRYGGNIGQVSSDGVFTVAIDRVVNNNDIQPIGIHLSDPAQSPVVIPKRMSAGIATDYFELPYSMKSKGPWLIAPAPESAILFRPAIHVTEDMNARALDFDGRIESLHKAATLFHPESNPDVFDNVISEMEQDISHSGWLYLSELKAKYSFLPLSAFKAWHALTQNTQSLAIAVFRLEIEQQFCKRFVSDLAVIWEEITVDEWRWAIKSYRHFLASRGVQEVILDQLIKDRLSSLGNVIPAIKHMGNYLTDVTSAPPQAVPVEFLLPGWYQDLRRRHSDDEHWPEYLDIELDNWLSQQPGSEKFTGIVNIRYEKAVAFLPVFMAFVSAGKASLSDLHKAIPELRFSVRVLSDFDREGWYEPVYALVLSNLIKNEEL